MASYIAGRYQARMRPWCARRWVKGKVYYLGYYRTRAEAELVEEAFHLGKETAEASTESRQAGTQRAEALVPADPKTICQAACWKGGQMKPDHYCQLPYMHVGSHRF